MTPDPIILDRGMEFPKVLRQRADVATRRIPITTDGEVVEIVTLDDCLIRVASESAQVSTKFDSLADIIEAKSPNS